MKHPPVALFVFNRYKDLPETLSCLRDNEIEQLFIFADGSRGEHDDAGVAEVRKLISSIEWIKPTLVIRDVNLGLSESIQQGLDFIFESHDSVVVVEDDVCVAPWFYRFMTDSLKFYYDEPAIAGVTGLRYPFDRAHLDASPYDVFLAPRFSSWGWGTWKDRWKAVSFDRNEALRRLEASPSEPEIGGLDLVDTMAEFISGRLSGCWDIYFLISMLAHEQEFVWPKYNMVRNTGFLEGSHSTGQQPKWQLNWERQPKWPLRLAPVKSKNGMILNDFLSFFAETRELAKANNKETQVKQQIKAVLRKAKHVVMPPSSGKPDPKEYTTTAGPMEVPCQKETYFYALNHYVQDGDKVLDVGMGIGYGMNLLSIKAKEVCAVDVDAKAVAYCKENVLGKNPKVKELKVYDGYNLPYGDNTFDVVTCVDVVEHVEDYHRFIDELLRVAKRAVIFGTPNRRPEYTNEDGSPKNHWHLREWSFVELDEIMRQHKAKLEWTFLDGPWEGPFLTTHKVNKDSIVLLPALVKQKV